MAAKARDESAGTPPSPDPETTGSSTAPPPGASTANPPADWAAKYRRSRRWNLVLGVTTAFLAVVVAAQLLPAQFSPTPSPSSSPSADGPAADGGELEFVRRDATDVRAIGAVDAPVVVTMWTDLRCPFCALFSRDTLPILVEEYVDTGKVRIEFHDVAFFGEQSESAAVAALAAGEQGRYVEFVTAIYDAAPENGHADLPPEALLAFADAAGVPDLAQFAADLTDPRLRAQAQSDTASAQQLGVSAVPFFVARSTALSGAQPIESFRGFLDQALTAAK